MQDPSFAAAGEEIAHYARCGFAFGFSIEHVESGGSTDTANRNGLAPATVGVFAEDLDMHGDGKSAALEAAEGAAFSDSQSKMEEKGACSAEAFGERAVGMKRLHPKEVKTLFVPVYTCSSSSSACILLSWCEAEHFVPPHGLRR